MCVCACVRVCVCYSDGTRGGEARGSHLQSADLSRPEGEIRLSRVDICSADGTSGGEALRLKADLTLRRTVEGKRRVCVCVCVCVCAILSGAKHADDAADRTRCLTR